MRSSTGWSAWRMDGREQLRRYLEQRKEAGERELLLDQLSVSEVLRLLGAGPATAKRPASGGPPETSPSSSDWREVLRNAGVSPAAGSGTREAGSVSESLPASPRPASPRTRPLPEVQLPHGLSVGDADRELFGG